MTAKQHDVIDELFANRGGFEYFAGSCKVFGLVLQCQYAAGGTGGFGAPYQLLTN